MDFSFFNADIYFISLWGYDVLNLSQSYYHQYIEPIDFTSLGYLFF